MRRILTFILVLMLTVGCSCEKRLQRFQRSCPGCFTMEDCSDSFVTPPHHIDTVLHLPTLQPGENITVQQDKMTLNINIDDDTNALISADLPPDTVRILRKVVIPGTQKQCSTTKNLALLAVCLFFAWAIIYTIKRKRK